MRNGNCSVPSQLQAKIHAESPLAMGFLLGRGTLSYGQRSECADLLNSYGKELKAWTERNISKVFCWVFSVQPS